MAREASGSAMERTATATDIYNKGGRDSLFSYPLTDTPALPAQPVTVTVYHMKKRKTQFVIDEREGFKVGL